MSKETGKLLEESRRQGRWFTAFLLVLMVGVFVLVALTITTDTKASSASLLVVFAFTLVAIRLLQKDVHAKFKSILDMLGSREAIEAKPVNIVSRNRVKALWRLVIAVGLPSQTMVVSAGDQAPGWEQSYRAGEFDDNGQFMGGSTIVHLVGHKGRLFAGNSYWQDSRNIWYGGKDRGTGWAQVLRLDKPGGRWTVDLEMGPQHLRVEILKSVTFKTDGRGRLLKEPVNLLVASTFNPKPDSVAISMFARDDATGKWTKSTVLSGPKPKDLDDRATRAIRVHHDKVTGVDRIFLPIGKLGIFSGVYDAAAPGKVRWDSKSESGPVEARPLAIIESGGKLLFSAGRKIYRRNDGESPSYTVVHDMSDLYPEVPNQDNGGIRGLSAIPSPGGGGESLLFAMAEGRRSRGAIYRLDPTRDGGYSRVRETYLDKLMSKYLKGNPVYMVLAAYNDIYPVVDPGSRETVHLIGFESWIGGHRFPIWGGNKKGGFYAGGMYAIRDKNGNYRLKEINGRITPAKPPLVATCVFARSPFEGPGRDLIYFGGHDGNYRPSHNMAWLFSTSLKNALRPDPVEQTSGGKPR